MARTGLFDHPKFKVLCRKIGGKALAAGSLELIWHACYAIADDFLGDAAAVEAVAEWMGADGVLCAALESTGFIEKHPDGYRVHDFWDHAPEHVKKKADREAARRAAGKTISDIRREAGKRGAFVKQTEANGEPVAANGQTVADVCRQMVSKSGTSGGVGWGVSDPPVSPASGGAVLALTPPAGKPTRAQRTAAARKRHEADAAHVLAAMSEARIRCIDGARPLSPTVDNLKAIIARLEAGATVDDCLHVIAVREAEVSAKPESAQWFNPATTFTADQFTRAVAMPLDAVEPAPANPTPQAHRMLERMSRPS